MKDATHGAFRETLIRFGIRYADGNLPTHAELMAEGLSRATAYRWLRDLRAAHGMPLTQAAPRTNKPKVRKPKREAHKPKHGPDHPYNRVARARMMRVDVGDYDGREIVMEALR